MFTNEQRAHDIAMMIARTTLEHNATKYSHGQDVPKTPFMDLYFEAYDNVLPQIDWKYPKDKP